jgi:hypothetical protein
MYSRPATVFSPTITAVNPPSLKWIVKARNGRIFGSSLFRIQPERLQQ